MTRLIIFEAISKKKPKKESIFQPKSFNKILFPTKNNLSLFSCSYTRRNGYPLCSILRMLFARRIIQLESSFCYKTKKTKFVKIDYELSSEV